MIRNRVARLLPTFVAFVAIFVPSTVAAADYSPQASATGTNCVEYIQPVVSGQPASRIVSQVCFDSFADAIFYATGGYTRVSSSFRPEDLTDSMLPHSPDTLVVIGIDYDNWHYGTGHGDKIWQADVGCDFSHWYEIDYVGDNWNDRISSAQGFTGCVNFRHFENSYYGGAVVNCTCYYIGDAMNDRTSSLQMDN